MKAQQLHLLRAWTPLLRLSWLHCHWGHPGRACGAKGAFCCFVASAAAAAGSVAARTHVCARIMCDVR
eukprot:scaffold68357_cov21-Tisochrysis_lutea.AAC.1